MRWGTLVHGFRCASPVATIHGPSGAGMTPRENDIQRASEQSARSVFELLAIVKKIIDAGGQFLSLAEAWRALGQHMGRPPKMTAAQKQEA